MPPILNIHHNLLLMFVICAKVPQAIAVNKLTQALFFIAGCRRQVLMGKIFLPMLLFHNDISLVYEST